METLEFIYFLLMKHELFVFWSRDIVCRHYSSCIMLICSAWSGKKEVPVLTDPPPPPRLFNYLLIYII